MYPTQWFGVNPSSTASISRWKVDGAFLRPNGMTRNSKDPAWVKRSGMGHKRSLFDRTGFHLHLLNTNREW